MCHPSQVWVEEVSKLSKKRDQGYKPHPFLLHIVSQTLDLITIKLIVGDSPSVREISKSYPFCGPCPYVFKMATLEKID